MYHQSHTIAGVPPTDPHVVWTLISRTHICSSSMPGCRRVIACPAHGLIVSEDSCACLLVDNEDRSRVKKDIGARLLLRHAVDNRLRRRGGGGDRKLLRDGGGRRGALESKPRPAALAGVEGAARHAHVRPAERLTGAGDTGDEQLILSGGPVPSARGGCFEGSDVPRE